MSLEGKAITEYASLSGKIHTLVIDKTLSIGGACADAKATGERLDKCEAAADELLEVMETFVEEAAGDAVRSIAKAAAEDSAEAYMNNADPDDFGAAADDLSNVYAADVRAAVSKAGCLTGAEITLLWENASREVEFAAQTVALDLTKYDFAMVYFLSHLTNGNHSFANIAPKDSSCSGVAYGLNAGCRSFIATDSGVSFADGQRLSDFANSNKFAIPTRIYGIKAATGWASWPILAGSDTWYKSTVAKSTITAVNIVGHYTATGNEDEVWNADAGDTGAIKCYRTGTVITMAPTTADYIRMDEDSSRLFEGFNELETINGLDRLDSSEVTTLYHAFLYCYKLKRIYAPSWRLDKCTDTAAFAPMAYQLEEINIGEGLPAVGQQFAYLCTNLRKVSGVSDATTVAAQAFHCCYRLTDIDLKPEKITSIGDCAFFLTPVEDTVDLSAVPSVGKWATRAIRWDADNRLQLSRLEYPEVLIDVPNPDTQNAYPDVQYTTKYTVQGGGCTSLAIYHAWNAHYAGTDKEFSNWKDWWDTYYNSDGQYAATHTTVPSEADIASVLGWTLSWQIANSAWNFDNMFNALKNGDPVYISREISGTNNHSSIVVGVRDGKLLILDSAGRDNPVEPVTYALRIEDVFIQGHGSDGDNDGYNVINFND